MVTAGELFAEVERVSTGAERVADRSGGTVAAALSELVGLPEKAMVEFGREVDAELERRRRREGYVVAHPFMGVVVGIEIGVAAERLRIQRALRETSRQLEGAHLNADALIKTVIEAMRGA